MTEVFPVVAGVLLGIAAQRIASMRWRMAVIAAASVLIGWVASAVSGELAESWLFILVDTAQVLVVALLTGVAVRMWRRRGARVS